MALEVIKNINVDFHDTKYIMVNAKQYDDRSRWIAITCYNQGSLFNLSTSKHSAYVKYRKADGYGVLNYCRINNKGEVLVELTEQMLAADGICYVDLVIVNKGSAIVNVDTGEIITIDESPILSTMAFCVNVYEATIMNPEIESSYEYDALNDLLQRAEADYTEVMLTSKSWAVGKTGIRDGENTDNSKYYSEQSSSSASASNTSALNAANSERNAEEYMSNALEYMNTSKSHMDKAETSMNNAKTSEINAANSEVNAKVSETNSSISEDNAFDYSVVSQRYAVGGTNTVSGEDTDNAKYYYGQIKGIYDGLDGSLSPKGTIAFEALETAEKFTGALYVMNDSFVTDETFVEGDGIAYPAGTLVYYTVDGLWATFDGVKSDVATVDEVKSYLGI